MVGVRAFTPLCNSSTPLLTSAQHKPICFESTAFSYNSRRFHLSFLSNQNCLKERNGFRAFAVKKRRKDKGGVLELASFDNEGYEFDDDEDEDDEEEGLLMPMEKMKQWLENKPAGFGQGKVYDTTVEDKLLDEMQQSRVAQLANINKLKHNPIPPKGSGLVNTHSKAPEVVTPTGIRVRLLNLPKKKNIHRDLQLAFKEVPGIISISPAVTGSKKTRDPICKGYGFVYFKSEEHANRFIQIFTTRSIAFGKVQKQIKCELASPSGANLDMPMASTLAKSSLPVLSYQEDDIFITRMTKVSPEALEESDSDESDGSDDFYDSDKSYDSDAETGIIADELEQIPERTQPASDRIKLKSAYEVTTDGFEQFPEGAKPAGEDLKAKSVSTLQETKPPAKKKAVAVKVNGPKPAKLGSANKLKSKDKSLLTGVFSKYGANARSTTRKDS
uniref:RRM domain-containing protein n=1 Tax=Kalanchoe fedtschenkoi TaxID=63787 RepID=A0A7N0T835_KALFE